MQFKPGAQLPPVSLLLKYQSTEYDPYRVARGTDNPTGMQPHQTETNGEEILFFLLVPLLKATSRNRLAIVASDATVSCVVPMAFRHSEVERAKFSIGLIENFHFPWAGSEYAPPHRSVSPGGEEHPRAPPQRLQYAFFVGVFFVNRIVAVQRRRRR